MYRSRVEDDLSQADLDAARLGFSQLLRIKRFSPQFIANHSADLLATAQLEYSRRIAEGIEIHNPPGWIINCAWRRTKGLLESQAAGPRLVSTERVAPLGDERATVEDEVLSEDRSRKVREAVEQLTEDQRKLIELAYFEQMSVREAARLLNWHSSKAQRCHEAARDKLHKLLGVQSGDELQVEIGLAAWLSLASARTPHLHAPAGIEAAAEKAGHGATHLWGRAQEIVRRFLLGGAGEPSTTIAAGSAARTAGVCGAAALACLASGVVGPGVGGVDLLGAKHRNNATRVHSRPAQSTASAPTSPAAEAEASAPSAPATSSGKFASQKLESSGANTGKAQAKESGAASTPAQRTEEEFSPFGSGEGSASSPTSSPTPAVRTTETSSGGSSSGGATSAGAARGAEQTSQEFSPFR